MAFWTQYTRDRPQDGLFRQLCRVGASQESSLKFSRDVCDDAAWTYSAVTVLQGYTNPTSMQSATILLTCCGGMTLDHSTSICLTLQSSAVTRLFCTLQIVVACGEVHRQIRGTETSVLQIDWTTGAPHGT